MKIGYRRVSSYEQNLSRQDLNGMEKIYDENVSGASTKNRPVLEEMISFSREGDEIHVWSIDRLARDLRDLQNIVDRLNKKGVTVNFVSEGLVFKPEGTDPFSRLHLHLMGAFVEFERSMIRKRQAEGIAKAKERGVYKGRKATIDSKKIKELKESGLGASAIARQLKISRVSVYRVLKK